MSYLDLNMKTIDATNAAIDALSNGLIIDGINDNGEDVEPTDKVLIQYDYAIRTGDDIFVEWVISTYGISFDVPILQEDPYTILDNADFSIILSLNEMEYIELSDIICAIIYDDPMLLEGLDITPILLRQIIKNDNIGIYNHKKDKIIQQIRALYKENISLCMDIMNLLHGEIKENILLNKDIYQIYTQYMDLKE